MYDCGDKHRHLLTLWTTVLCNSVPFIDIIHNQRKYVVIMEKRLGSEHDSLNNCFLFTNSKYSQNDFRTTF